MKQKGDLILAIVQLVIGLLAVASFVLLVVVGEIELIGKWTITFLCAVIFVILGVRGIIDYRSRLE